MNRDVREGINARRGPEAAQAEDMESGTFPRDAHTAQGLLAQRSATDKDELDLGQSCRLAELRWRPRGHIVIDVKH